MTIVIDTGAIWHRIRRAFTSVFGRMSPFRCVGCNVRLTTEEHYYYGHNCERCEGIEFGRAGDGSGHA